MFRNSQFRIDRVSTIDDENKTLINVKSETMQGQHLPEERIIPIFYNIRKKIIRIYGI